MPSWSGKLRAKRFPEGALLGDRHPEIWPARHRHRCEPRLHFRERTSEEGLFSRASATSGLRMQSGRKSEPAWQDFPWRTRALRGGRNHENGAICSVFVREMPRVKGSLESRASSSIAQCPSISATAGGSIGSMTAPTRGCGPTWRWKPHRGGKHPERGHIRGGYRGEARQTSSVSPSSGVLRSHLHGKGRDTVRSPTLRHRGGDHVVSAEEFLKSRVF